jgi:hypothetical protein
LPLIDAALRGMVLAVAPLPTGFTGLQGRLLNDPSGFARAGMALLNQPAVAFFGRHLQALNPAAKAVDVAAP